MKDFASENKVQDANLEAGRPVELLDSGQSVKAYVVRADNVAEFHLGAAVESGGVHLKSAGVFEDEAALVAAAAAAGAELEVVDIPAGDARDAVLRKWAKAAKKNKKGLVPLLLLPLAACGGGGVDSLLTSYDGDVAGAKAVDATNYTSDFTISVSDAGAVAASELTEVAGKTTGDVTSASVTSVSGTAAEVQAALDDAQLVSLGAVDATVSDAGAVAATVLTNLAGATTGDITSASVTSALRPRRRRHWIVLNL